MAFLLVVDVRVNAESKMALRENAIVEASTRRSLECQQRKVAVTSFAVARCLNHVMVWGRQSCDQVVVGSILGRSAVT